MELGWKMAQARMALMDARKAAAGVEVAGDGDCSNLPAALKPG
jgi:hypothetical protein